MTMNRLTLLLVIATGLTTAGCVSQQQALLQTQDQAVSVALRRGQFELGCPTATGVVLSSTMLQPIAWRGFERAEYTVGVAGCGKKASYIVICPEDSSGCVAGASRTDGTMN